MRERPSPQLIAVLERLGAATAAQVQQLESRVRRLSRDLPCFDSVWVDVLSRARILTPFQAAEINAGRGDRLRVGPLALRQPVGGCDYLDCFRAERLIDGSMASGMQRTVVAGPNNARETVRLALIDDAGDRLDEMLAQLQRLAEASKPLSSECLAPIVEVGADGQRLWVASRWVEGPSAAEWMVHHGRFPPEVVLEIARAMLAGLVDLESHGLVHGDISTAGLLLTADGNIVLPQPGLRGVVRPAEGFAHADLRPSAYDALAPERISAGTLPTTASDIHACGCVWWHLLCGRPPLGGGDSLSRLRRGQAAAIEDLRQWVHDAPAALADAIDACLQRDPSRRPESMARLASMLGPANRRGRQTLARCLRGAGSVVAPWSRSAPSASRWKQSPQSLTAAAAALILVAAIAWPIWRAKTRTHTSLDAAGQVARRTESDAPNGPTRAAPSSLTRNSEPSPPAKSSKKPLADPAVARVAFETAATATHPSGKTPGNGNAPLDLVLPSDRITDSQSLALRAGQRVGAAKGQRARLRVAPAGLIVKVDEIRFENVDFLFESTPGMKQDAEPPAIVRLCAAEVEFDGCRFLPVAPRASSQPPAMPVAILWTHPIDPAKASLALPSGRVRLRDCVLRDVDAAVSARTLGAIAVQVSNSLQLGGGPLLRLARCPGADEPLRLVLSQVTLRGGGALVECHGRVGDQQPGQIEISATGCVFAPRSGTALLTFLATESPEALVRNVRWGGQGSLVLPSTPIATWVRPEGGRQVQDDSAISIAGLVRSSIEFAGPLEDGPSGSRVTGWQAPLQSADTPGADLGEPAPATKPADPGPAKP